MIKTDFLVVGAGIVGVNIALTLKRRHPEASVTVIDKEPKPGLHSSGRNSGVIHAGFYYTADSLKAKFTRNGNIALTAYCEQNKLPLNKCGKLVVAQSGADLPFLDELLRRGEHNGVPLESMSEDEARKIEPRVKTFERAIFSPTTSTADPSALLDAICADARSIGVSIQLHDGFTRFRDNVVTTRQGTIEAGYIVNAAGLYADAIARNFGFSQNYRIVPFKGLYLYSDEPVGAFRTNIYPVPDLRNPFLGVHFTVTVDGHGKIGPTAIPAFWREQYDGLQNFHFPEFVETVWREMGLILYAGFDFKRLAVEELMKYNRRHLVRLASNLATGVKTRDYQHWGKPGIRAQLLDVSSKKLEMDFVLEGDEKSMHVLNAVSPGWTCAIPFADYVVDKIEAAIV